MRFYRHLFLGLPFNNESMKQKNPKYSGETHNMLTTILPDDGETWIEELGGIVKMDGIERMGMG